MASIAWAANELDEAMMDNLMAHEIPPTANGDEDFSVPEFVLPHSVQSPGFPLRADGEEEEVDVVSGGDEHEDSTLSTDVYMNMPAVATAQQQADEKDKTPVAAAAAAAAAQEGGDDNKKKKKVAAKRKRKNPSPKKQQQQKKPRQDAPAPPPPPAAAQAQADPTLESVVAEKMDQLRGCSQTKAKELAKQRIEEFWSAEFNVEDGLRAIATSKALGAELPLPKTPPVFLETGAKARATHFAWLVANGTNVPEMSYARLPNGKLPHWLGTAIAMAIVAGKLKPAAPDESKFNLD